MRAKGGGHGRASGLGKNWASAIPGTLETRKSHSHTDCRREHGRGALPWHAAMLVGEEEHGSCRHERRG